MDIKFNRPIASTIHIKTPKHRTAAAADRFTARSSRSTKEQRARFSS